MTETTVSVDTLSDLASRYAADPPGRVRFTPRSRWSRRVHTAADHEVWLLGWLPGQGTELHDHGGTHRPAPAAFAVVTGELSEYTVVPGEYPSLATRRFGPGTVGRADSRTIHAIRNAGDRAAVSVHVYAPRLAMMRRYLLDETGLWLASLHRAGTDW